MDGHCYPCPDTRNGSWDGGSFGIYPACLFIWYDKHKRRWDFAFFPLSFFKVRVDSEILFIGYRRVKMIPYKSYTNVIIKQILINQNEC